MPCIVLNPYARHWEAHKRGLLLRSLQSRRKVSIEAGLRKNSGTKQWWRLGDPGITVDAMAMG